MIDTGKDDLKKVVNSYCYITGTYTVDKHHAPGVSIITKVPYLVILLVIYLVKIFNSLHIGIIYNL